MMVAQDIIEEIRKNIVAGRYRDSGRLPTREELTHHYKTSRTTVQKALSLLEEEGFVISQGKRGTYVNPEAPPWNDIAVILPDRAESITEWNLLLNLLHLHQREFDQRLKKKFRFFYVDAEQHAKSDYEEIARKAERNHFSGVFFPMLPQRWMMEPFIANRIPIAVLTDEPIAQGAAIWLDYQGFFDLALRHFRELGCRRVALLCDVRLPRRHVDDFTRLAGRHGLETSPKHIHGLSTMDPYMLPWLPNQLAATLEPAAKVDALLVADHAFLHPVLNLLSQANLVPGRELRLAAHCNFPHDRHQRLPARMFGFDVFDIMASCLAALDKLREGRFAAAAHPPVRAIAEPETERYAGYSP